MNLYDKLPIINNRIDFDKLNSDLSEQRINQLLKKRIFFRLNCVENGKIIGNISLMGLLMDFKDGYITVRLYPEEDIETELNKDIPLENSKFKISEIIDIEEYKKYNSQLELKEEFIGSICKITNIYNISMTVMITDIEDNIINYIFRYADGDNGFSDIFEYPFYFLKDIKILEKNNIK